MTSTLLSRRSHHPTPVFSMPRAYETFARSSVRFWVAMACGAIGIAAAIAYIISVNSILLNGQEIQKKRVVLVTLKKEHDILEGLIINRQSPAELELASRGNGMIETEAVRYVFQEQLFVLSR